jgi:hypothetical protein
MKIRLFCFIFLASLACSVVANSQTILYPTDDTLIINATQNYRLDIFDTESGSHYVTETNDGRKRRLQIKNNLISDDQIWSDKDNLIEIYWDNKGRIYRMLSFTKQISNDSITVFRLNGIVNLFSKGKLRISAYYEMGVFKYLLYYYSDKYKRDFMSENRDDISRLSIDKVKSKRL